MASNNPNNNNNIDGTRNVDNDPLGIGIPIPAAMFPAESAAALASQPTPVRVVIQPVNQQQQAAIPEKSLPSPPSPPVVKASCYNRQIFDDGTIGGAKEIKDAYEDELLEGDMLPSHEEYIMMAAKNPLRSYLAQIPHDKFVETQAYVTRRVETLTGRIENEQKKIEGAREAFLMTNSALDSVRTRKQKLEAELKSLVQQEELLEHRVAAAQESTEEYDSDSDKKTTTI